MAELYIRNNPIKDLHLIQKFPSLTKLIMGKTITDNKIPNFSPLKQLKILSLQNNNLTSIPDIFTGLNL